MARETKHQAKTYASKKKRTSRFTSRSPENQSSALKRKAGNLESTARLKLQRSEPNIESSGVDSQISESESESDDYYYDDKKDADYVESQILDHQANTRKRNTRVAKKPTTKRLKTQRPSKESVAPKPSKLKHSLATTQTNKANEPEKHSNSMRVKEVTVPVFEFTAKSFDPTEVINSFSDNQLTALSDLEFPSSDSVYKFALMLCRSMKYSPDSSSSKEIKDACTKVFKTVNRWESVMSKEVAEKTKILNVSQANEEAPKHTSLNYKVPSKYISEATASVPDTTSFVKIKKEKADRSDSLEITGIAPTNPVNFATKIPKSHSLSTPGREIALDEGVQMEIGIVQKAHDTISNLAKHSGDLIDRLHDHIKQIEPSSVLLSEEDETLVNKWAYKRDRFVFKELELLKKLFERCRSHSSKVAIQHSIFWNFLQGGERLLVEGRALDFGMESTSNQISYKNDKAGQRKAAHYDTERSEMKSRFGVSFSDSFSRDTEAFWNKNAHHAWSKERDNNNDRLSAIEKNTTSVGLL